MAERGANPISQDRNRLVVNLVVRDAARAIELYKKAFGAEEVMRMPSPDGKSIWHAELRIGDTLFYVNDEMPGMGAPAPTAEKPAPISLWVGAEDCDAAHRKAVAAGARSTMEPADMFWGDRVAEVADGFGYLWSFAQQKKKMTFEEMKRAGEEFARQMAQQRP